MKPRTSIFFISDLHLGAPDPSRSLVREKHLVKWLNEIQPEAKALYLLGDIFDFWFEYRHAVPKGHVRFLGKLAEMVEDGVEIHLFTGNHDLWYKDYFPKELGIPVHTQPLIQEFYGKKFYFAHGDGLGPGDTGYKLMKKVSTHPISIRLFAMLHPFWGISLARYLSGLSRKKNGVKYADGIPFFGEKEFLFIHSQQILEKEPDIHYFIYGHRHLLKDFPISEHARFILLGDWIQQFSYLRIDPGKVALSSFPMVEHPTLSSPSRP